MSTSQIVATFFFLLWALSVWIVVRRTGFRGWVRYVHAITALPLLIALVTMNVAVTGRLAPGLLEWVEQLPNEPWNQEVRAFFGLLVATPIAGLLYFLWIKLLIFADRAGRAEEPAEEVSEVEPREV